MEDIEYHLLSIEVKVVFFHFFDMVCGYEWECEHYEHYCSTVFDHACHGNTY